MRWRFEVVAAAAAVLVAAPCNADAADEDPSHGRVDGDASLVAGAGAAFASGGVRPAAELRLRYLQTAGAFVTYEGSNVGGAGADPVGVLSAGLEVRPLFLLRWLKGLETTRARFDLAVDSFGLELGAIFEQAPGTTFASTSGLEVALGVELPMFAVPTGPWIDLHGGIRWSDRALGAGDIRTEADRALFLAVTLAWHQELLTHAVDVEDRPPQ
jgi:hypothetical protein